MLQYAVFNFKIKNKGKIATHDKEKEMLEKVP